MRRIGYLTFSFQCWLCAILSSSSGPVAKMLSGANAFEISEIQEERNASRSYQSHQNITMLHCYIASKTCHRINSPETGSSAVELRGLYNADATPLLESLEYGSPTFMARPSTATRNTYLSARLSCTNCRPLPAAARG